MEQNEVDIRLIGMREMRSLTRFHRWEFMRANGSDVDVELSTKFDKDHRGHAVRMQLGAHYSALRGQIRRRLLDYVIETEFEIVDSEGVIEESRTELVLTPDLLRLMLSVSIGAIRGMIALRTAHTFLAHFPLPVYDLDSLIGTIAAAGNEYAYRPAQYSGV